jgi:RNA polymerase sigma-70 factor (ECF subfamily)
MGGEPHWPYGGMLDGPFASPLRAGVAAPGAESRLRAMMDRHFDGLWAFCRRLGLTAGDLDDAMQEVIFIAAERLDRIESGCEKSFLFATAFRVASELRRKRTSRREVGDDVLSEHEDAAPGPEALLDQARARKMLDDMLSGMPLEQRAVFVLYEIEECTMAEIGELLGLRPGTVASRLRRGRCYFQAALARMQRRTTRAGGQP